ncbi:MAG: DUF1592 domain-containing protein [Verrucomicrobiales bacterium]
MLLAGRGLLLATSSPAESSDAKLAFEKGVVPFVNTYCVECHGSKKSKAGLNLETPLANPASASAMRLWKQALSHVKTHDMPPEEADKLPTDEERRQFHDAISQIKYLSPKDPGLFVIRRLTKIELGNTLRDLLGADPKIAEALPDEDAGEGYLNRFSPLQSEQYLEIANNALLPGSLNPEVQKQLFGDMPAPETDPRAAARGAARSLARQAYRRPPSEEEVELLLQVFDLARENGREYRDALLLMLKAVLVSPQFLFITPAGEPEAGQAIVPLDDYQLASRLSYFLWATMPDAGLSALADAGKLRDPAVLKEQVTRMLGDPRSRALFDGFGMQWLRLHELKNRVFDDAKFPEMTPGMRAAMLDEVRLFFESVMRENQSVVRFVDSDYTFLNETLASFYGLQSAVTGPEMRKVALTDANRGGVLGMSAVLAATSHPNRTSLVKRGVWVLEQLLGEHVPPAPPNVPELESQNPKDVEKLTLRQRTALHQADVACANCHKLLDPIGFGLENFDAIGRWRERDDTGGVIDAAAELPGGEKFASPRELKAILAARKGDLARNLTEKMLAFALCRRLEGYDEIVVDNLMENIKLDDYRMHTLVSEIVTSYPFMHRRIQK